MKTASSFYLVPYLNQVKGFTITSTKVLAETSKRTHFLFISSLCCNGDISGRNLWKVRTPFSADYVAEVCQNWKAKNTLQNIVPT